ncbi:MAG: Uma2 family endonuclease [Planctomycetota bacterium]
MTVLFTRNDYEALPEGMPVELLDGLLVKQPSPRWGHQRIQNRILASLGALLGPDAFGPRPLDVLVDEVNVFVPDIVVHAKPPDDEAQYVGVPAVVFEILSPSAETRDHEYKARRYLGLGVREVWLVDRVRRRIAIVDLDGITSQVEDQSARSRVIPGFELTPSVLFAAP